MDQKYFSKTKNSFSKSNKNPTANKGVENSVNEPPSSRNQDLVVRMYPDGHIEYPTVKTGKRNRIRNHVKG